ncbi:MAG: transglutaminase domain-containing protein [Candidatus Avispirillum sp.]
MKKESARVSKKLIAVLLAVGAVLWLAAAAAAVYCGRILYKEKIKCDFLIQQQKWLDTLDDYKAVCAEYENAGVFCFASKYERDENGKTVYEQTVSAETIADYESVYSAYNSYYYYDKLTPGEQLLYKAYEYASDNCFGCIFVDNAAIWYPVDHYKIGKYLSFDSAVVSQGLWAENNFNSNAGSIRVFDCIEITNTDKTFGSITTEKEGYRTVINSFSKLSQSRRAESIEAARNIVKNAPDIHDELERARYLYITLCDNITYDNDYDGNDGLYDALINHIGQCDGFSNALSLIYNIAGITCAEKGTYYNTWVSFCADGVWYNADPTYDCHQSRKSIFGIKPRSLIMGFGYSDAYTEVQYGYEDVAPECTGNTLLANCRGVDTDEIENIMDVMLRSIAENSNLYGYVQISKDDYLNAHIAVVEGLAKCPSGFVPFINEYEFRGGYLIFVYEAELK